MFIVWGEEEDKICGLDVGVDDYVIKLFLFKEFIVWIKVVMCCVMFMFNEELIEFNGFKLEFVFYCVMVNDEFLDMGFMEFKLLYFFMMYLECVYSCELLFDNVWGINVYVEDCIVDVYIRCLCKVIFCYGYDVMI